MSCDSTGWIFHCRQLFRQFENHKFQDRDRHSFGHISGLPPMLKKSFNSLLSFLPLGCWVLSSVCTACASSWTSSSSCRLSSHLSLQIVYQFEAPMCCMTCYVTVITKFIHVKVPLTYPRSLMFSSFILLYLELDLPLFLSL